MLYCIAFTHSIYLCYLSPLHCWWPYPVIVVLLLSSRMSASGCRNQLTLCTKPSSCAGRMPTLISIGFWSVWLCSLWLHSERRGRIATAPLRQYFCQDHGVRSVPVTSAEGERSFSQLWLLKTFLRATMGEEHLVGLALMQCYRQLVTQLDQEHAAGPQVCKASPRRTTLVNIFQE